MKIGETAFAARSDGPFMSPNRRESSVWRRLCHANCLNEGLAFDGRNSSKAPISRLSFFLFSDQSGNLLDSLSELACKFHRLLSDWLGASAIGCACHS